MHTLINSFMISTHETAIKEAHVATADDQTRHPAAKQKFVAAGDEGHAHQGGEQHRHGGAHYAIGRYQDSQQRHDAGKAYGLDDGHYARPAGAHEALTDNLDAAGQYGFRQQDWEDLGDWREFCA